MSAFTYCPRCARRLEPRATDERARLACPSVECGFVHYDNPTPVVAGIVERDGCVVLVRNHGWPAKLFGLVTGFLERDETPAEGIVREVREELGLEARVVSLVGAYAFPERNEVIVAYHLEAAGKVAIGTELEAYKAVPIEKLRAWPFGTGLAVAEWLARR